MLKCQIECHREMSLLPCSKSVQWDSIAKNTCSLSPKLSLFPKYILKPKLIHPPIYKTSISYLHSHNYN